MQKAKKPQKCTPLSARDRIHTITQLARLNFYGANLVTVFIDFQMEIHHVGCNTGNKVLMKADICRNPQSHYVLMYISILAIFLAFTCAAKIPPHPHPLPRPPIFRAATDAKVVNTPHLSEFQY